MSEATTILHIQGQDADAVEGALEAVFAQEERPRVLRLEGTYSAVLARVLDPALEASYRYLICQPHLDSTWTPLLELGNRTVGLDAELSRRLGGCAVFSIFSYGEVVAGYRLVRAGAEVDHYLSDPLALADLEATDDGEATAPPDAMTLDALRGHPERFADLLPTGTTPDDFARVVLQPGWWEEQAAAAECAAPPIEANRRPTDDDESSAESDEDGDATIVDERDRMRCIALALELWGPTEYPLALELEDIPNVLIGPATVLAFA